MTTKIILFFALISYSIIVSQSFMYILALKNAQLGLKASSYTELRQLIDTSMRSTFKYVVYGALLANLLLVIFTMKEPRSILFITATIGFLALVIDTMLTVKGSLPINDIINAWTPDNYPADWSAYRDKWLNIYRYRQIANITGFVSLVIGTVFGTR